jgi:hypothetical protein
VVKAIDHVDLLAQAGRQVQLAKVDPGLTCDFKTNNDAGTKLRTDIEQLSALQEILYAMAMDPPASSSMLHRYEAKHEPSGPPLQRWIEAAICRLRPREVLFKVIPSSSTVASAHRRRIAEVLL